jgi:hypothetical protein
LLKDEFPRGDFEVLNLSVLAYSYPGPILLKKAIDRLQPDVLLIGFAMNDSSVAGYRDKDTSTQAKPKRVSSMVRRLLKSSELLRLLGYAVHISSPGACLPKDFP